MDDQSEMLIMDLNQLRPLQTIKVNLKAMDNLAQHLLTPLSLQVIQLKAIQSQLQVIQHLKQAIRLLTIQFRAILLQLLNTKNNQKPTCPTLSTNPLLRLPTQANLIALMVLQKTPAVFAALQSVTIIITNAVTTTTIVRMIEATAVNTRE